MVQKRPDRLSHMTLAKFKRVYSAVLTTEEGRRSSMPSVDVASPDQCLCSRAPTGVGHFLTMWPGRLGDNPSHDKDHAAMHGTPEGC
jgi:hypothetical protein